MKIFEILTEDLGNLNNLKAGNLINMLKQSGYYNGNPSSQASKFQTFDVGQNSEIVDIGSIKAIADIRKAYRNNANAIGGVIYIGDTAVLMFTVSDYNLAGKTRDLGVAWDISKFSDESFNIPSSKPGFGGFRDTTSALEKEVIDWSSKRDDGDGYNKKLLKFTGVTGSTGQLATLIEICTRIADEAGQPLTCKLILKDQARQKTRGARNKIRDELEKTTVSLRKRLEKYKLSKKPTAQDAKEFASMAMNTAMKTIQFAGAAYKVDSNESMSVSFRDMISGKPFNISYSAANSNIYNSVVITYAFVDGKIVPISAVYHDFTDPNKTYGKQEVEYIDPTLYATKVEKMKDVNDKDAFIRRALGELKDSKLDQAKKTVRLARELGHTWPELDIIDKSIKAEEAKK